MIGCKICIVIIVMYVTNLCKIRFKIIVTNAGAKFQKIQSLDFKNFGFEEHFKLALNLKNCSLSSAKIIGLIHNPTQLH